MTIFTTMYLTSLHKIKYISYKIALQILLRLPDFFFAALFTVIFPIYKALHKKRAYGRVEQHLEKAKKYVKEEGFPHLNAQQINKLRNKKSLQDITARDVFHGIFWNAIDSYRGLAHIKNTSDSIVYENEYIIQNAIAECAAADKPIAAISIHQGAFELLHRSLCRYSKHVHLITDSVGDSAFRDVLKELRSDPHLIEYHPEETSRLIRELFRTKGILAMVVDQGKHTKGNTVSLFGQPSTLYLRLPKKVNDMGAGIVIFRTWTENDNSQSRSKRIVIRFENYYPPKYDALHSNEKHTGPANGMPANSNEERATATIDNSPLVTAIASEIETWIAEHPEQWSWNYHGNFTTVL